MIDERDWGKELDEWCAHNRTELMLLSIILFLGKFSMSSHFNFTGIGELELNINVKEVTHGHK